MPYLVRVDGPDEPLVWEGKGQHSIGVYALPKNEPIKIRDFQYGAPAADGSYHKSGSRAETRVILTKRVADILREIRSVYHSIEFKEFPTRDEALSFIQSGKDDYELLGVDRNASPEAIRRAYIVLSMSSHPDLAGPEATEKFQKINAAYQRLKDK